MAMFPKLPPVINGIDVIDALPLKESVKEAVVDVPADGKRFVIVCSRDLSS